MKKKGLVILTIVLLIMVFVESGYILYKTFSLNSNTDNEKENEETELNVIDIKDAKLVADLEKIVDYYNMAGNDELDWMFKQDNLVIENADNKYKLGVVGVYILKERYRLVKERENGAADYGSVSKSDFESIAKSIFNFDNIKLDSFTVTGNWFDLEDDEYIIISQGGFSKAVPLTYKLEKTANKNIVYLYQKYEEQYEKEGNYKIKFNKKNNVWKIEEIEKIIK